MAAGANPSRGSKADIRRQGTTHYAPWNIFTTAAAAAAAAATTTATHFLDFVREAC